MGEHDRSVGAGVYDGMDSRELARRLGVPSVVAYREIGSTMDVAHALAEAAAPAGTLVLADRQTAGRGRNSRQWVSPSGCGIWLTLIERPTNTEALPVLALRLGLRAARALDPYAAEPIGLKWPNDLYVSGRKLAGILTEIRWHDQRPLWVAIGVGVNLDPPATVRAAGLAARSSRLRVLAALVPALRGAAEGRGPLSTAELDEYARRDIARGRRCRAPAEGRVDGLAPSGELLVERDGVVRAYRSGSLVLATDDVAAGVGGGESERERDGEGEGEAP